MSILNIKPILPLAQIITAAIIVTIVFIWLELKKTQPLLWVRILAILLLTASLLGLAIRPQTQSTSQGKFILLTKNYSARTIDSLLNKFDGARIYGSPGVPAFRQSTPLNYWNSLTGLEIDIIVGEGLPPEGIDAITDKKFQFIPVTSREGIVDLSLQQQYRADRPGVISGTFFQRSNDSTKIVLTGPGGREDSVIVRAKGKHKFRLNFTPKVSGRTIYTLSDGTQTDTIPLTILEERMLNILFLQHQPDFESNFLKNHLRRRHQVSARYKISAGKYRNEKAPKHRPFNRMSEDALRQFHLGVIDSDALSQLSASEKAILDRAVSDGLGLLIMPNNGLSKLKEWIAFENPTAGIDTVSVTIGGKRINLRAWSWTNRGERQIKPMISAGKKIITASQSRGIGKVGLNLLHETYSLKLKGDSLEYNELWMTLIDEIAKPSIKTTTINTQRVFPLFENQPLEMEILSSSKPSITYHNAELPLIENPSVPNVFNSKLWTQGTGWDSVVTDHPEFFFTFSRGSWEALVAQRNMAATARLAVDEDQKQFPAASPIPSWLFYSTFILSAAILWAIARFYPRRRLTT